MMAGLPMLLLLLLSLPGWAWLAAAQEAGWIANQVNTSMCQWQEPRAAIIRDTVYLDGGYLWWQPGLGSGMYGSPYNDGNPLGIIYTLNFSTPFNVTSNISAILGRISKAPNGGAVNNFGPNYYDGAMFANDGEFFTYGGLLTKTDGFVPPGSQDVLSYQAYWYGAAGKKFTPGFVQGTLPSAVNRFVTAGGAVSVPSENLGYYFSGLTSATKGQIFYPTGDNTTNADVISNTLISVDMSAQTKETWANQTLPTMVSGRINPEIVWVPVSKQGVLIVIGGVVNAQFTKVDQTLNATEAAQNQQVDPGYMKTVSVYDVASGTWYNQPTTGDVPQGLTQGCTVVASAQDGSSHNIYFYGGFDGVDAEKPLSDDVFVLSVPSFTWIKLYSGTTTHGRAGHKCVKPYPDQMLVIGGYSQYVSGPLTCVEGGLVQIFNLSSGTWMTSYDPAVWSNYSVPSALVAKIGGNGAGGAQSSAAITNQSLAAVFKTAYDATKIKAWYPYSSVAPGGPNSRPSAGATPTPTPSGGGGLPSWVAPVLGVVLGLVGISAILVCILLWRRRKYLRRQSESGTGTSDVNRYRIMSWMRGADPPGKAVTVTSDETPSSPSDEVESPTTPGPDVAEAASSQVHEMADTSQPQELSATGMSYVRPSTNVLFPGLKGHGSHSSTSTYSDFSDDTVSSQGPGSPMVHPADSPSLGTGSRARFVSGVSATSSDYRGLASTSDEEVAGDKTTVVPSPEEKDEAEAALDIMSPVSPPTPHGHEGKDYLSKPSPSTPSGHRKSNFGEMLDESS